MPTYNLPDLPNDLRWLIDMEPTRENLDGYIYRRGQWPFSVTNVLASPPSALPIQKRYDVVKRGILADAGAMQLLVNKEPFDFARDELYKKILSGEFAVPWQWMIPYLNIELPSQQHAREQQRRIADIDSVCGQLLMAWDVALRKYAGEDWGEQLPLHLDPYPHPLPERYLLEQLCSEQATLHLILLTARHELGYFHHKAMEWKDRSLDADRLDAGDEFFSPSDWQRLSSRQRGYHHVGAGRTSSTRTHGRRRKDAPVPMFSTDSGLARLYFALERWCVQTYEAIIEAPPCGVDGCPRRAKPRSDVCRLCAKKQKAEKSHELYVAMCSGHHEPTPSLKRKWARGHVIQQSSARKRPDE